MLSLYPESLLWMVIQKKEIKYMARTIWPCLHEIAGWKFHTQPYVLGEMSRKEEPECHLQDVLKKYFPTRNHDSLTFQVLDHYTSNCSPIANN